VRWQSLNGNCSGTVGSVGPAGGDRLARIGYLIGAVETDAAAGSTTTVAPLPRPQTVRRTARRRVSLRTGFQSSAHRQEPPMCRSARLFPCARCRRQVVICSHCDRGNRYCGKRCAQTARRQSQREAARRYQRTRRGRFAHAERQRRYRQRRRAKVTHQGSRPLPPDDRLPVTSRTSDRMGSASVAAAGDDSRCHLCGRRCSPFVRQGFLHRRPTCAAIDLPPPPMTRDPGP